MDYIYIEYIIKSKQGKLYEILAIWIFLILESKKAIHCHCTRHVKLHKGYILD
jgi:hypothetical protein